MNEAIIERAQNEQIYEDIMRTNGSRTAAEMTAISELNRVDGFDPSKFIRKLTEVDENGQPSERMYLEVAYRKLWFRLKHPEGAIRKFIREVNDQFAIMEARVYLDRRDPEESYIANAIVKRYFHPKTSWATSIWRSQRLLLSDVLWLMQALVSSSPTVRKIPNPVLWTLPSECRMAWASIPSPVR